MLKTYLELIDLGSFQARLEYLRLNGIVGADTFGGHRYLNQMLYTSPEWKSIRRRVILRDNGCDLAHNDFPIHGSIYIHHINPITVDDILEHKSCVFDLNNLISSSYDTHNAIHYGTCVEPRITTERERGDTLLW